MAGHKRLSGEDRTRAEHRVEVFARAMFALRGLDAPSQDRVGDIVGKAVGEMNPDELRDSSALSGGTIARIGQLISSVTESGTPRNRFAGPDRRDGADGSGPGSPWVGGAAYSRTLAAGLAARRGGSDAGEGSGTSRSTTAAYNQMAMGAAGDPAFLRSQGLSAPIGRALAGLGFTSAAQIKEVVRDAKQIGLPPAAAVVPLATIRKFEGPDSSRHMVAAFTTFSAAMHDVHKMEQAAEQAKDPAQKAELKRQAEERRRKAEEEIKKQRDQHMRTQQGRNGADQIIGQIKADKRDYRRKHGNKAAMSNQPESPKPPGQQAALERLKVRAVATADLKTNDQKVADIGRFLDEPTPKAVPAPKKTAAAPVSTSDKIPDEPTKPAASVRVSGAIAAGPKPT